MSLNQLPDELIAHAASFLQFEDTVHLLQTQKRVNRILKNFKKDRLNIAELILYNRVRKAGCVRLLDSRRYDYRPLTGKCSSSDGVDRFIDAISMFNSISSLIIIDDFDETSLDDNFVQKLIETGAKIRKLRFRGMRVNFSVDGFAALCKNIGEIGFHDSHLLDDVLCRNILVRLEEFNYGRTFETAILDLRKFRSGFTVQGIRRYVETLIERNSPVTVLNEDDFGILNETERIHGLEWFNYANEHPELPYRIIRFNYHNRGLFYKITTPKESTIATFSIK